MGSWDYTSYVRTNDVPRIVRVLEFLFQQEGYALVETEAAAWPESFKDSIQYDRPERKHLAFAVLPGLRDWSIIKTAPFDILARPVPGHLNPRLSILAGWLSCDAIYAQEEDDSFSFLIEVNSEGRTVLSGWSMSDGNYEDEFYLSPLQKEQPPPDRTGASLEDRGEFLLFPEINPHLSSPTGVAEIATHLTGLDYYASLWDGHLIHELLAGRPWPMEGAISQFLIREPREASGHTY